MAIFVFGKFYTLKNKNPIATPPDPLFQKFTIVFSTSPHEILDPPLQVKV